MPDYAVPKKPIVRKIPSKTPDYNPDKERHVDHTFVVSDVTRKNRREITLGDKTVKLNNEGRAFIKDEGLAREIQTEHRWDACVTRMRTPSASDAGHHYVFSMPAMPWHKYDANGKRIVESPKPEPNTESEADNDIHPIPTELPNGA